jgi:hypothetical protein
VNAPVKIKLSKELLEAFAGSYLSPRYDDARATPEFHRKAWELYCSEVQSAMVIAPRDHAKTTALSVDFILAEVLFRRSDYVILVGSTEPAAQEILSNISDELHENELLKIDFQLKHFEVDQKTELIVHFQDGQKFRILARGSEQRIRGKMWNGKRPNLLVCDDMEDDEQVESRDRRAKFRRWFFRAAKQALSRSGRIRVHGTILHEDSLLSRLRKNKTWKHLFFKAHESFDDFSNILWPERWDETSLRHRRMEFIEDQDAAGYSQEFLNDPFDNSIAYLRKDDFLPMLEEDFLKPKVMGVAADFAISTRDKANRTSFTVGGKCVDNLLHIVDERVGRWNSLEIIEEMFTIHEAYNPEVFWVEDGQIWKALAPMVYQAMQQRDQWINIVARLPITDKASRGRSYQRRHRAHGMRFNKQASWYPGYEAENLRFTGIGEAVLDDQFDSTALLSLGFDDLKFVDAEDMITEDEWAAQRESKNARGNGGRNKVTGY